jgi:hypothetical protein
MELVPYNPYFIGERALPNRLKGALDRVSFTLGAADRIALFPERYRHPHRRRSPRGPLVDDHYSGSRRNTWPPIAFDQPQRRVNSRRAYADVVADAGSRTKIDEYFHSIQKNLENRFRRSRKHNTDTEAKALR